MNNFENQICHVAKEYRNKHDATLKIPMPPKVSNKKTGPSLKWWIPIAAALCIGFFLGRMIPYKSSIDSPFFATIAKSKILRDTIFTTIRDTLYINQEVPIYVPVSQEKNIVSVDVKRKPFTEASETVNLSYREDVIPHEHSFGKSILDDTIHYALLVSM